MTPQIRAFLRATSTMITRSSRGQQKRILSIPPQSPTTIPSRPYTSAPPFPGAGPSPPRLPPEEQAEFERLQRLANTQDGFNPTSTPASLYDPVHELAPAPAADPVTVVGAGSGSQPLRKGAPPEFEGDVNPKTGEVGGPKNEPLRWGASGDYSFNGRVTDF